MFPLETARLRLRALVPEDAEALHAVYAHPLVARWIGAHGLDDVRREIEWHVATIGRLGHAFGAVEERVTGRLVGDCGLQLLEHRGPDVELGYDLHPDAWGRGYATEAARACVTAGCERLGLQRIVAVVRPNHTASRRVLEKTGLVLEGPCRAYDADMLRYAIRR